MAATYFRSPTTVQSEGRSQLTAIRPVGVLVIASLFVVSLPLLPRAQASSILELVGADAFLLPKAPAPAVFFSVDVGHQLPSRDFSTVAHLELKFADSENPTPLDRTYFQYEMVQGSLEQRNPQRTWTLTDTGRARTGIEVFTIKETTPSRWSFELRDLRAPIPDVDYSHLCITLQIDGDSGSTCIRMQPSGNVWNGL